MAFDFTAMSPMTRRMVKIAGGVVGVGVVGALAVFGTINAYRPSIDPHADLYALQRPIAYTFVDAKGAIVGHHGAIVGERLKLADLPDFLPAAFLAMEDRKFYAHRGVDWRAMVRAFLVNTRAGDTVQGGSTITQQLVKILFLTPERTVDRKLREIGGAWTLEASLSKDQILELYLNRIYLGSGAYGVDGAARTYFGKSARDVTLSEAAMLAALTRSPSAYTPRHDLQQARARANIVLGAMLEAGLYDPEAIKAAKAAPATTSNRSTELARAYFFDAAAEEVRRLIPGETHDLIVLTTFDAELQNAANAAVEGVLTAKSASASRASQASLVAMEPNGAVRALVGGRDYAASQFNRATQAKRQPGSAFKAFVYLAAMESGASPWDYRTYGDSDVTLADGIARSLNSVATNLQQEVGTKNVIRAAEKMGIRSGLRAVPSLALGTSEVTPLELTGAYAGFASGGYKVTPYFVVEARTPDGDVVYRLDAPLAPRVIRENISLNMNAMLLGVVETGTARAARIADRDVAGKTGTSNDYRDAWFVGYTPQMVTGVWLVNDGFHADENRDRRKPAGANLEAVHDRGAQGQAEFAVAEIGAAGFRPGAANRL